MDFAFKKVASSNRLFTFSRLEKFNQRNRLSSIILFSENKAGYTATPVVYGWAGAVFEVTSSLGQEQ